MNILMIARDCPFPPTDGGKIRVFNLIKNLSRHDITLVCRTMDDEEVSGIRELEKYCTSVRAVYIPSPSTWAERLRWVVPFIFSSYPIGMSAVFFEEILEAVQEVCAQKDFDVIQVEHSSLTIYLDYLSIPAKTGTLLTMHNIDYVRNYRVLQNMPFGVMKFYLWLNQLRFKQWELASLKRYDRIVAMSEDDKHLMLADSPGLNIDVVPNGVDTEAIAYCYDDQRDARHIVFVASMNNDSNHDGAMYFLDRIFPLIKNERPDAVIHLVGRSPRGELRGRHNGLDVEVTGMVPSIYEYYQQAAVAVVPLRSGGGTRLKVLEAMAAGVPVVSTTVGAEGINVNDGDDIVLANTPEEFAHSVLYLLNNSLKRESIARKARSKVEKEYDWRAIAIQQNLIYESI